MPTARFSTDREHERSTTEDFETAEDEEPEADYERCNELVDEIMLVEQSFKDYCRAKNYQRSWGMIKKDAGCLAPVLFMSSMCLMIRCWQIDCLLRCNRGDGCECARSRLPRVSSRGKTSQKMPPKGLLRGIERRDVNTSNLMHKLDLLNKYKDLFYQAGSRGQRYLLGNYKRKLGSTEANNLMGDWNYNFRDTRKFYEKASAAMKDRRAWNLACTRQKELFWKVLQTTEAAVSWMRSLNLVHDYRFWQVKNSTRSMLKMECRMEKKRFSDLVRQMQDRQRRLMKARVPVGRTTRRTVMVSSTEEDSSAEEYEYDRRHVRRETRI